MNNNTIVDFGLRLNDACWNTYAGTAYVFRHHAHTFQY